MTFVAKFKIKEQDTIKAKFSLDVKPNKVSQLENDLGYQTQEQVQEAIQSESTIINGRINEEVARLEDEIEQSVITIEGSALIDASKSEQTVTLTSKTFIFEQGIASETWVINHNLGKRPSYDVVDSAGMTQLPNEVTYNNDNQMTMRFLSAFSGYAYLN